MKSTPDTQILPLGAYEKEQLAKIPIRFLFRAPRLVKLNASFVFIRDHCPEDITCLLDLFTVDLFKRKPIRNVRDYVFENKERLIEAFIYYSSVPIIPSDVSFDDPIGLMAERFICEYVDRMRFRNSLLISEEAEKRDKRVELFESAYDDRVITPFSKEAAAEKYGMTPERIRQLLLGTENTIGITLCRGLIQGVIESDDFKVNPIFQSRFDDFVFSNKYAYDLRSFMEENGIHNEKTCQFLLDLLGLTICESNNYFEPLVIKGENISALNHNAGILIKFFSDAALYLSLIEDVAPYLQKRLNNNTELVNIMLDIVRCSDRFEPKSNQGDDDLYALKWQYLQSVPAKIVRIIYDSGGPLHTTSIFEEYNRRAQTYEVDLIPTEDVAVRRSHPLLVSLGKTGYWKLKDNSEDSVIRTPNVRDVIDSFLREHEGKAYLKDVIEHVSSVGLNYSDKSIKTYLSSMCRAVRDHIDLFVHNDYLDYYPSFSYASKVNNQVRTVMPIVFDYLSKHGGHAKMRELVEDYNRKTGKSLRDTTLRTMVASFPGIIRIDKLDDGGIDVVLSVSYEDALRLLDERFISKRPSHYNIILTKAKELILASTGGVIPIKKLYDDLVQYVPDNRRKVIVYKLIQSSSEFETFLVEKKKFVRLSKRTNTDDHLEL